MKNARKKIKLSQSELAKKAKLSRISIGNYERGDRTPNIETAKKIADALEISVSDLTGWKYFDEVVNNKLSAEVKSLEAMIGYLKAIGYTVEIPKTGESESGYWEEHKDDNGSIIGKSWIPDEEFYEIYLYKDGKSITFTDEEFKLFHETINKTIEYQIWLKTNKK